MPTDQALQRLHSLLAAHGFEPSAPKPSILWNAFKEWVAVPAVDDSMEHVDDALLFETHLFTRPATQYSPGPRYTISFTRQFSYYRAGNNVGMEQLYAEIVYPDCSETRAIASRGASEIWGKAGPTSTEWTAAVEADRNLREAAALTPTAIEIERTPV